jgi:hypothetical protein
MAKLWLGIRSDKTQPHGKICAEPMLSGRARQEWEHSIPPVDALRYSITFRNFAANRVATTPDVPYGSARQ